jgi:hypothetical protein
MPDPEITNGAERLPNQRQGRFGVLGAVAVTTLLCGGMVYGVNKYTECPGVDEATVQEVEELFDQPEADGMYWIAPPDSAKPTSIDRKYSDKIAQKYGLHFFNYALDPDVDAATSTRDFSGYLKAAQGFAAKYGVNVSIGGADRTYEFGGRAQDLSELDNSTAQNKINRLMVSLSQRSVEYIRLSNLQHIVLANTGSMGGYADSDDHTYYVNLLNAKEDVFDHEITHLVDTELCNGNFRRGKDPQFAETNPVDIYKDKEGYISYDTYQNNPDLTNPDQIVAPGEYSFRNVEEHKAELGSNFGDARMSGILLDRRSPVLRRQYLIWLSRIFVRQPDLVRFEAETTPHQADNPITRDWRFR